MRRRMKAESDETPLACAANEGGRVKASEVGTLPQAVVVT